MYKWATLDEIEQLEGTKGLLQEFIAYKKFTDNAKTLFSPFSLPIGYQAVTVGDNTIHQLRYACAVKPIDSFVADPDNTITAIKLIDPLSYKEFLTGEKLATVS